MVFGADWTYRNRKFRIATGAVSTAVLVAIAPAVGGQTPGRGDGPARGVVRAVHQAALSSDLAMPVTALKLREGDRFRRSDVLIEFDCRRQQYELAALEALVQEAKVTVDSNEHLASRGAANRNDVATARARFDKAKADWSALSVRLSMCTVHAPFDGVVTELGINAHETPSPSRPYMSIVSDRLLEVEIILPSRLAVNARAGDALVFSVDENGSRHDVTVRRTGGAVDPVSQTVKIFAVFTGDTAHVLPGMSGTAFFTAK